MIHSASRRLASNSRGQAAFVFALIALPILLVTGMALDVSRQVSLKRNLQSAVDTAVLAAARTYAETLAETTTEQLLTAVFDANRSNMHADAECEKETPVFDEDKYSVSLRASCKVPTAYGIGISGNRYVTAEVTSTAAAIHTKADVAMMFDLSNSMSSTEADALKTAGKRAAGLIIGSEPNSLGRVAVIPFAGGVNGGNFGNLAMGRASGSDDEGDGVGNVCVTERTGADAATDADPTVSNVGQVITGSMALLTPEYDVSSEYNCPVSAVHPLDNELTDVKTAIDNMAPGTGTLAGTTMGHMGIAWSWYTISPNWNSVWETAAYGGDARRAALPYSEPNAKKIAILMTDGIFTHAFASEVTDTDYDTRLSKIAALSKSLCLGMRNAGIIVYAVAYDAPSDAEDLLKDCTANDPDFYFETSDHTELDGIYARIASKYLTVGLTN